jgi:hypothetical protein
MSAPIGFVLVTHGNPEQVLFLCERLTAQFDCPPIVVHHDFGKCSLDRNSFPKNVTFVQNWSKTRWGGYGVVDGVLKALRILYKESGPDWFVLLSGADYPIKSAKAILDDLNEHEFDAYIDHRRIAYCMLPMPTNGWGNQNFIAPAWVRLAFERYMAIGFGFYKLATRLKWKRKAIYLRSDFVIRRFTPFDGTIDCYAGDFWFTANRRAANILIEDCDRNRKLAAHFRKRPNPDEAFFQTALCNARELKRSPDNRRYADWVGCVNHPRALTDADYPALLASTDHFARKLAFNPTALRVLNRMIDDGPP